MLVFGVNENNITFGWKHATHKLLTKNSVNKYNQLLPKKMQFDYEILKYSCVEPDFSRKNITKYIHGHFADIDNLHKDPPDARNLFFRYTHKVIEAQKHGNYKKRDDYLGYALHFLQDMLNPMHVDFQPRDKADPIRLLHKEFESKAVSIQEFVFGDIKHRDFGPISGFYEKILPDAMRTAKKQYDRINKGAYTNISEVVVEALANTYKMTDLYFKVLVEEFSKSRVMHKQQNLVM